MDLPLLAWALGSWLAEFIVRAVARTVLLFDSAMLLGGLLVRQNYVEADLGGRSLPP